MPRRYISKNGLSHLLGWKIHKKQGLGFCRSEQWGLFCGFKGIWLGWKVEVWLQSWQLENWWKLWPPSTNVPPQCCGNNVLNRHACMQRVQKKCIGKGVDHAWPRSSNIQHANSSMSMMSITIRTEAEILQTLTFMPKLSAWGQLSSVSFRRAEQVLGQIFFRRHLSNTSGSKSRYIYMWCTPKKGRTYTG